MTVNLEREVKLGARRDLEIPPLRDARVTALLPVQELSTVYCDTSDFRLFNRGITFRQREGEDSEAGIWTLKLPSKSDGPTLDRTELSWPGDAGDIPPEALRILRGVVRHSTLGPVVRLTSTRHRLALRDAWGESWAELDDDTVTVRGGPRDGLIFRQLELELKSGDDVNSQTFEAVIRQLREAGAKPEDDTKLEKALGLSDLDSRTRGASLGKNSSLAGVVRASIAQGLDRILDHDYLARLDPGRSSPSDVHQMRVATRRLRSDLKTFAPVLDPVWLGHIQGDLKWLGGVLGKVRDTDVLMENLFGDPGTSPGSRGEAELRARLAAQRTNAAGEFAEVLEDSDRYIDLLDRLHGASQEPPLLPGRTGGSVARPLRPKEPARRTLPKLGRPHWHGLKKKARAARHHPSDRDLHRIRIRAKQVRYASEAAMPVIGKSAQRAATAAKSLQELLGDHHDAVAAEAWLRAEAPSTSPEASFLAGQLAAGQHHLQEKLRRRWRRAWHKLEESMHWC